MAQIAFSIGMQLSRLKIFYAPFVALASLMVFQAPASAQMQCANIFYTNNSQKKYDELNDVRFQELVTQFTHLFPQRNNPRAVDSILSILDDPHFKSVVDQRLQILIDREMDPTLQAKIQKQLPVLEGVKKSKNWVDLFVRNPSFINAKEPHLPPTASAVEASEWKVLIENYRRANQQVIQWATQGQPITVQKIESLNRLSQEGRPYAGWIYGNRSFNYILRKGEKIFDPRDTFISGGLKRPRLEKFVNWLNENFYKENPILLAAKAREILVSIHAFDDGNGRLARWISDYILIRHGYPPALMPSQFSSREGLLPLRGFEDQPRAGESAALIVDGLARSFRFLGEGLEQTNISAFEN